MRVYMCFHVLVYAYVRDEKGEKKVNVERKEKWNRIENVHVSTYLSVNMFFFFTFARVYKCVHVPKYAYKCVIMGAHVCA